MRILYHHRTHAEDGQAVHIRSLQSALREEGHELLEVSLVPRSKGKPSRGERSNAGFEPILKAPLFVREVAEYGYSGWAAAMVAKAALRFRPDFIYERYAFGNAGGVLAARAVGVPIMLEVNSPLVQELERTRGLVFPRVAGQLERQILRSADLVCAVTGVLRDILIDIGAPADRVVVIPNGVHLEDYARADPVEARRAARERLGVPRSIGDRDPLVLGFTGYYRDWHRLDLAIDALADPDLAHAVLVIVGEGQAHASLVGHAAKRGVSNRVLFPGPRPHRDIPALLPAFDVGLVPAINAYASPLKLQEYMASGLAVIAPDQPNIREVIEDAKNGWLVPPNDREALLAAMKRLAAGGEIRRWLGAAARQTIVDRDLTWRGNARRVLTLMRDRIGDRRARPRATGVTGGARHADHQPSG